MRPVIRSFFKSTELILNSETTISLVLIFYFMRTIFPPLKYPFLILGGLFFIVQLFVIYRKKANYKQIFKLNKLIILYLIYLMSLLFSIDKAENILINETINGFIVISLTLSIFSNNVNTNTIKNLTFKFYLFSLIAIGTYAIIMQVISAKQTISIVSDYNFYALYFFYGLFILIHFVNKRKLNDYINLLFLLIIVANIILSLSRRAHLLFLFIIIVFVVIIFIQREKHILIFKFTQKSIILIAIIFTILFTIFQVQFDFKKDKSLVRNISISLYRLNTIIDSRITFKEFNAKLWNSYIEESKQIDYSYWDTLYRNDDNLLYNGQFSNGLAYWTSNCSDTNSVKFEILEENKAKFVRVSKNNQLCHWSLVYKGRNIFYYKNVTYSIEFKYRIIKGNGKPFKVGWWVKDNGSYRFNLPQKTTKLNDGWYHSKSSYKFMEDHHNLATFMNSQELSSIIDFTDIKISSNDSLNRVVFYDQISNKNNLPLSDYNTEKLTQPRISRWKYAFEIWQKDYKRYNKLFGQSFDYLAKYKNKFAPDKEVDYPHNPIISSFLYSGIIGGLYYLFFLSFSFIYYIRNRKSLQIFLFMYLVTFFFMMFSANSHFSVPIFTFLSIIPFIENYKQRETRNAS